MTLAPQLPYMCRIEPILLMKSAKLQQAAAPSFFQSVNCIIKYHRKGLLYTVHRSPGSLGTTQHVCLLCQNYLRNEKTDHNINAYYLRTNVQITGPK